MTWHIFKKDCWLAWPFILVVALLQVANAVWMTMVDPFSSAQIDLIASSTLLSVALLIGLVVHQDAVPGNAQDWLVRPIGRGQLLAAKLLFVLAAIHAPIFVVNVLEAVVQGFPFAQSLGAALSRNIAIAFTISLPSLVLAVVTRTLGGMFFGILLFVASQIVVFVVLHKTHPPELRWLDDVALYALILVTTCIVLPLQYFRRRTPESIALICVAVLLMSLTSLFPWQAEFAIQQRMSPRRDSASALSLQFAPEAKLPKERAFESVAYFGRVSVSLPLRIAQLPPDSELLLNNAAVRIYDTRGTLLHRSNGCMRNFDGSGSIGYCARSDFWSSAADPAQRIIYYGLHVPEPVYERIKKAAVRLEIEYSVTTFRVSGSYALPANANNVAVPGIGRCSTRPSTIRQRIDLRCRTASRTVPCLALAETPSSGMAARTLCPFNDHPNQPKILPSVLTSFGDPAIPDSLARHRETLSDRTLAIRAYQPDEQWMATIVIPKIRLSQWALETHPF